MLRCSGGVLAVAASPLKFWLGLIRHVAEVAAVCRLKRLDVVFPDAPVYFVTACTWRRRAVLAAADVKAAVESFGATGPSCGAWLGAYVLMPDHLQAFVAVDCERCPLSRWMKGLKACIAKAVRARGVAGPVWQKGFFDHLLRSGESASDKWAYVRANPVRAGLGSLAVPRARALASVRRP